MELELLCEELELVNPWCFQNHIP